MRVLDEIGDNVIEHEEALLRSSVTLRNPLELEEHKNRVIVAKDCRETRASCFSPTSKLPPASVCAHDISSPFVNLIRPDCCQILSLHLRAGPLLF